MVSLAPESINVGTSPFPKLLNPLLIKAIWGSLIGVSIITPDCPGVSGINADRTKLCTWLEVEVVIFVGVGVQWMRQY